jgi:DNA-binding beta-propeller fold protein YncE
MLLGSLSATVFAQNDLTLPDTQKTRVFVTNNDGSISLIRQAPASAAVPFHEAQRVAAGASPGAAWPANQYRGTADWWWVGLTDGQVLAVNATDDLDGLLEPGRLRKFDTYNYPGVPAGLPTSGSNFMGTLPTGHKRVWNAAREIDEIQEIDADPDSPTFGQILTHIPVPLSAFAGGGSATQGRMRPCDMSVTPDGRYLFEPDLGGETVTGVDIKKKQVVSQIVLPREDAATPVRPFMLTTNGTYALVENNEAPFGTYSIIDVRDPANPVHVKKITQADGLGVSPQTSEFTQDGQAAYLITNGSPSMPGRIDVLDLKTFQIVKHITLPANCRPHAGDFSRDGRHFFVNCSQTNSVAVIDTRHQEVAQDVALSGSTPRGVIVR